MDTFSAATAFATVVSLIGNFATERRGAAAATYEEFLEWLVRSNHRELVELLTQNSQTAVSIKALLKVDHEELINRLHRLDKSLAQIATGFNELRELALTLYPDAGLSDQALSILGQFVNSGASKMVGVSYLDRFALQFADGSEADVNYTEPRFLEDDLNSIVEAGLVRFEANDRGDQVFSLTRAAVRYVQDRRNERPNSALHRTKRDSTP